MTFRRLTSAAPTVPVVFETETLHLPRGENLASALMVAGIGPFRATRGTGAPRGPFCMMGVCFDCLLEINGVTRQACMMQVADGMVLRRPRQIGQSDD